MPDREQDEFDVAVVVYGRSQGADRYDAEDRLLTAVRHALIAQGEDGRRLPTHLSAPHPTVEIHPQVADIVRLTTAPLVITASAQPFKERGMKAPRKATARVGPWPCTVQPELMHELAPCDREHDPVPIGTSITRQGMSRREGT